MSLIKHTSTIAGFTIISRIFGFVRDMLLARVLGAGLAADAYQLAFTLPNTFRRLFAEGAFSVAFVPMYSRKLAGENGEAEASQFADDILSVFVWILLGFSALAMIAMPLIVYALASEYANVSGKFELAVFLSRVTFPYLFFISLVAMLSGLLNARSRFAPGAIAPVLFNITLIGGIIAGYYLRGDSGDDRQVVSVLSVAVSLSGLVQFVYLWWAVKRAGLRLKFKFPKITPEVKRLGIIILPATFGAGIYQISQFVDTFFATSLPQGSLTLLKMGDRLNQMPLGLHWELQSCPCSRVSFKAATKYRRRSCSPMRSKWQHCSPCLPQLRWLFARPHSPPRFSLEASLRRPMVRPCQISWSR